MLAQAGLLGQCLQRLYVDRAVSLEQGSRHGLEHPCGARFWGGGYQQLDKKADRVGNDLLTELTTLAKNH